MKSLEIRRHRNVRIRTWMVQSGLAALTLVSFLTPSAEAQEMPKSWEAKAMVGLGGFLDSPTNYRFVIGGAIRAYVSPRFAIEPEFLYMRENDRLEDLRIQANLVRDFAGNNRVQPYLIGGIGVQHHRARFPGARSPSFSSNSLTGGGGAGLRIQLGDRFFMSPEFRLGTEPLLRATIAIGSSF